MKSALFLKEKDTLFQHLSILSKHMQPSLPPKYLEPSTCIKKWHALATHIAECEIHNGIEGKLDEAQSLKQEREAVYKIIEVILMVRKLYAVFQATQKVAGDNGVAKLLGITPNAVYLQLNYIGLESDDFRNKFSVADLLKKSRKILSLALKVRTLTFSS